MISVYMNQMKRWLKGRCSAHSAGEQQSIFKQTRSVICNLLCLRSFKEALEITHVQLINLQTKPLYLSNLRLPHRVVFPPASVLLTCVNIHRESRSDDMGRDVDIQQTVNIQTKIYHRRQSYLNVSQSTSQNAQIGGLLFIHIRDVLLQSLKTLL